MAILFTLAAGLAMAAGDEPITNSLGMKLLRIAPGTFVMGQEAGGDFDERPAHKVVISQPFHLAATEVTNAQYEHFDPNHARFRGKKGFAKDDDEAVVFVSWHDAARFCEWLTKKEGRPYRLPTEAEWEYACRAGTTTAFHTGDTLPQEYCRNQKADLSATPAPLHVGRTPANAWGLHDMHGNVEEWCQDWYGPYAPGEQTDPVGRAAGDFRVTRGGSHGTEVRFLRSANRMGTLPTDAHWAIGFRVAMGEPPKTRMGTGTATANDVPLRSQSPVWGRDVSQARCEWAAPGGYAADKPYFRGPRQYVNVPAGSDGPMFSKHNHQPAIAGCPNGDLLAIWYSCRTEEGRELAVLAARLRRGADHWDAPAVFWDAPDRNDHGSDLWWDGAGTMYHFNGLSTDMGWGKLALLMRTSTDSGATWSPARLIGPEHGLRHQVIAGGFRMSKGVLVVKCDAATGGSGGSAVHVSNDGGRTWTDPGAGKPGPAFAAGATGAWIAGIHAGVAELTDGRWLALGRGNAIDGQMPRSISADGGRTWTYSASGLPPIGSGQRLVLLRLREGPLLLASFAAAQTLTDAAGVGRKVSGLFAALSTDDGATWPVRRLVSDDGPPRKVDGGGNTGTFTLGPASAEPGGYLAATQTPDGIIHLIASKQHYAFNAAWVRTAMPGAGTQ